MAHEPETERVRWGVLSTANIGRKVVVPSIVASSNGVLTAVASREAARAEAFAAEFGGVRAHGSYEELLADAEVDALYVPLPNAMHEAWTVRALEAGKHVLCEKPLGLDVAEVTRMTAAAAAADRLLVEAWWYRWH
ncbi:MAG: Gfo/Idh/MocA family protein, partial [Trueperaceae bacterium]